MVKPTLDELLAIARSVQKLHLSADCDAARLANGIVDLLGVPPVPFWADLEHHQGDIRIPISWGGGIATPEDAQALAVMLLRARERT